MPTREIFRYCLYNRIAAPNMAIDNRLANAAGWAAFVRVRPLSYDASVSEPANPHDRLFKRAFSAPADAVGLFRAVIPAAIGARIDWSSLQTVRGTFVDQHLSERFTDLLFSVRLDGAEALLYLLLEHQSGSDRMMPLRLWSITEGEAGRLRAGCQSFWMPMLTCSRPWASACRGFGFCSTTCRARTTLRQRGGRTGRFR